MVYHLLVATGGMIGLVIAWVAVQGLKRRTDPELGAGDDVLACAACGSESCLGCRGLRGATGEAARRES